MKKTRLKRKKPLNTVRSKPRPGKDRKLRDEYMAANPKCELWDWLNESLDDKTSAPLWYEFRRGYRVTAERKGLDPHHIWGGNARKDVWSNLLSVSRPAHNFVTKNGTLGRVLCMYVKLYKRELNVPELDVVAGKRIAGWLEQDRVRDACLPRVFYEELRQALVTNVNTGRTGGG